jgi:hypothetical protein
MRTPLKLQPTAHDQFGARSRRLTVNLKPAPRDAGVSYVPTSLTTFLLDVQADISNAR